MREKYKLGSFIQEGSSACVYAAVDVKTGNPVAVKLWKTRAYGNPSSARWLLRERDVHSTLRHPNIPRFIEPVQFVTGPEKVSRELLHGFAMEHVQDDDLYETLNAYKMIRKQVSGGRAASLICQLALLVDYLAQRELFHSDIKTENIVESYETGLVKLLDLGSAHSSRSVDGSLPGGLEETYFSLDDTYTAKPLSVFPFTLETAAPERFDDSAPDIRSELYSVGVVLYKILTFRYPIAVSRWASHMNVAVYSLIVISGFL